MSKPLHMPQMRTCRWSGWLHALYRFRQLRPGIRRLLKRWEGGAMFSRTLRTIYRDYYGIRLGDYTYGPGLRTGAFWRGTEIGSYCSIADGVTTLRRNHPTGFVSQHPLFFNRKAGMVETDTVAAISENPLVIGSDVWIGLNAIICPGCRRIGNGAVIGAGAVVTRDVEPYSIVAGSPARTIRKRFPQDVEQAIEASQWWTRPPEEIAAHADLFVREIGPDWLEQFRAAYPAAQPPAEDATNA